MANSRERRRRLLDPPVALTGERWHEDFRFWVLERCRYCERYWTPFKDLHADFVTWNVARDCDAAIFAALLSQAGFCTETQSGSAWTYGLVLVPYLLPEDVERFRPLLF
jgi:hypothetical protein